MFQERYSKFFKDLVAAKDNAHVKQSDLVGKPNPLALPYSIKC